MHCHTGGLLLDNNGVLHLGFAGPSNRHGPQAAAHSRQMLEPALWFKWPSYSTQDNYTVFLLKTSLPYNTDILVQ